MASPFRCPVVLLTPQDPPAIRRWIRRYWARVSFSMAVETPVNGSRAIEIFDEFAKVTTPLQVRAAMENLVSRPWVRQFILDVGFNKGRPDVPLWMWSLVSPRLADKLTVLNGLTATFNSSVRVLGFTTAHGTSATLRRLFEDAHTREFHFAFDDSKIPGRIRLAYLSHQYLPLYAFILWGFHHKMVNRFAMPVIIEMMEVHTDSALGLALALNDREQHQSWQVNPLVLNDEIKLWREYLAGMER